MAAAGAHVCDAVASPPAAQSSREANVYFRLQVRHPQGRIEVEVSTRDLVADLKRQLEPVLGIPAASQRLLCRGALMAEERSLGTFGLRDGASLLAVPQILMPAVTDTEKMAAYEPKRGMLMLPTSTKWKPQSAAHLSPSEHSGFFDSDTLPAPWQICSGTPA